MRAPSSRTGRSTVVPLTASVLLHVSLVGVGTRMLLSPPDAPASRPPVEVSLELPTASGAPSGAAIPGPHAARSDPQAPRRHTRSGAVREPRPDTALAGRGGTREAKEAALHLSDSIDGLTLDTDPTLLTPESQVSRLDTDDERRSREDRRTTPNPMELTFVATGPGVRLERRPVATSDPSRGAIGAVPVAAGGPPSPMPADDPFSPVHPAEPATAGAVAVPASGVPDGARLGPHRRSAAIAVARPAIRKGRASISTTSDGRPADDVDSTLAVASRVQSLITASSAGGPRGEGPGGTEGAGAPGSGGDVAGTRSLASGQGGPDDGAEASGINGYAQSVTRKVYPYWEDAFPDWARAQGRGGVAVIGVTLDEAGRIRDLHVVRRSGFPEFDANVARALEQASPYGPLPRAVQRTGLTLHIAFDAMNPAVGRHGPGPGQR